MNESNSVPKARRVIRLSRVKTIVVFVIIIIAAIIWYMVSNVASYRTYTQAPRSNLDVSEAPDVYDMKELRDKVTSDQYYPGSGQTQPISDTREFLKTDFSATIQTRNVPSVVTQAKNIIKGADGRVDQFYSSEKSGRITFVVAKSKFDAFKDELEAITYSKLYTENISSQNLLGQKQNIEQQTRNITSTLNSLNERKTVLTTRHSQTVNAISNELSRIQIELITVRANIANTTDNSILQTLRVQETSLINQDAVQRQKLSSENSSYASQKASLDSQIDNYNRALTDVNKRDIQFADNIETVNGSINVYWVSLWQIAKIYSPISPVIIIIIIVILLWAYLRTTRFFPRVEWR